MTIQFITGNGGKVISMQKHLADLDITVQQRTLDIIEPQADTVEDIALSKARQAFRVLKTPLVVEDSAFCINELNGFPGPYIKYALQTIGIDGILRMTANLDSRECYFTSALVYVDEQGREKIFIEDTSNGQLATIAAPLNKDEAWSDLWRIYIADGTNKPLSALEPDEYARVQARWQKQSKFRAFGEWLKREDKKLLNTP